VPPPRSSRSLEPGHETVDLAVGRQLGRGQQKGVAQCRLGPLERIFILGLGLTIPVWPDW